MTNNIQHIRLVGNLRDGCVLRDKRWSGDTFSDFASGEVDDEATDAIMNEAADVLCALLQKMKTWEIMANSSDLGPVNFRKIVRRECGAILETVDEND